MNTITQRIENTVIPYAGWLLLSVLFAVATSMLHIRIGITLGYILSFIMVLRQFK